MTTLNPNNRNPKNGLTFWEIHKLLIEDGNGRASTLSEVGVGNETYAAFTPEMHGSPQGIMIVHFDTHVATLYEDDSVRLDTKGWKTTVTKKRLDWCLLPLGFRMTSVRKTWKVYSITTGAYRDYFDGMIVRKGEF